MLDLKSKQGKVEKDSKTLALKKKKVSDIKEMFKSSMVCKTQVLNIRH